MIPTEIEELLSDEALRLEPSETFDPAIVGIARQGPKGFVLCYSVERVIRALVKDGMSEEDAIEHFDFNVAGGWVGDGTPIFLVDLPDSSAPKPGDLKELSARLRVRAGAATELGLVETAKDINAAADLIDSMAQRVPLSDEQIRALVRPMDWPPSVTEIVRAVEQAHGIRSEK